MVRQSVSICEHLVERARIELRLDVAAGAAGDPGGRRGQLEQVLINLITNAVHAVETGGSGRRARTGRTRRPGRSIEVADSGPGVPERDRERIFEPFFTTKPDGKGTGLGLPIVRNIVEQHLGTVVVQTAREGGASFLVTIPVGA